MMRIYLYKAFVGVKFLKPSIYCSLLCGLSKSEHAMSPKKHIASKKKEGMTTARLLRQTEVGQKETDNQHLIHKLEMQNEALVRSQVEMQTILRQYADLYDFAPVGYFTLSRNGVIRQANLNGAGLLGMDRDWLIKQNFGLFISAEFCSAFDIFLEKVFRSHGKETCEIMLLKKKHETIWVRVESTYSDVSYEQGSCHLVVSDISEQKRTENIQQARFRITEFAAGHSLGELLQNALDELCNLTDSPIGFFHFVEPDQRTLSLQAWSTRTLKEMCTAEGKGQHYDIDQAGVWVDCVRQKRPVIHNDYASLPASRRKGLPQGHAPVVREMVFPIIRNQKIMAVIGVGNKLLDYTQRDVSYALRLADLIWDITERKRAESQRETALEALRESEARYRSILEDQTELICRYLPDGRLSFVNEAYARYYGETAQRLINTNFIPNIPEPDISMVIGKIAEITPQESVAVYEHRIIKPDGEIRWQRWTHRGIYNAAGELIEHQAVGNDITERKQMESALATERRRLADILKGTNVGTWEWNIQTGETTYNERWAEIVGYTLEELLPTSVNTWINLVSTDDLKTSDELLESHFKGELDYYECEARMRHKNGHWVWVLDRGKVTTWTDDGKPLLMSGTHQDITERKRSEEQIQFLARFPAEDPNPVLRVAWDGVLLYINESGLRLLPQWNLKIGETVLPVLRDAISQSMQNGKTQTLDLEHNDHLYAFYVAPIVSSGYANLYGHDITESRQARALRDAEARYHVVFEQSPYGILLADSQTGETIEANDITSRQLGYTRAEFASLKISDYDALENPQQVEQHMQKIVNEGSDDFETLHRTKNGEIRNVHAWVKKLQLNDRILFYTIFQDITERKRMEEANETYRREIALLEERQRIASDLHDAVSQALFSARLTAENLLRQSDRQTDSYTRSLIDLNRLVRSAAGEIRLILVELRKNAILNVNLNTLLANLIDSGMARTNANLVFQCHVDDLILPAQIKLAFYRIAQEAVNNAIKHGNPTNIHCILDKNGQTLEMIIQDDGTGFSIDKVSDEHFGLQIMRERAEQAGVDLTIVSQPGNGTSVTVEWREENI
jgi:PAS domain S-box-containing protein